MSTATILETAPASATVRATADPLRTILSAAPEYSNVFPVPSVIVNPPSASDSVIGTQMAIMTSAKIVSNNLKFIRSPMLLSIIIKVILNERLVIL